jgi:predicted DNA-binding transcriptional regulator AlpA
MHAKARLFRFGNVLLPAQDPGARLLTTEELAEFLRVDSSTIRRWRTSRPPIGPAYIPMSDRVVKYRVADVEAWLSARRVDPEAA